MNRKLKNLLKETYGSELPNRKFSFIQQLQNNPAWKKLHPISSIVRGYPVIKPVFAVFTTMAVATGIIAYNFSVDKNVPPDTPPIVTSTSTSATSTDTSTETAVTSTVVTAVSENTVSSEITSVTETTDLLLNKSTSVKVSTATEIVSTEKPVTTKSGITETVATTQTTTVQTTVQTTETESMSTTSTTSVYYTHLFRHDYTGEELYNDDKLLYGYPDYNFFEDIIRLETEEYDPDLNWDEFTVGMTTADFSEEMMALTVFWGSPTIVEGETTNIEYIAYEGKPWTICEITVSKVYNNDDLKNIIQKGDKIKIAMAGGYMPVSQYIELNPDDTQFSDWTDERIDSTVIYEDGSNQNEPKIGDKYAYFLKKSELDISVENLYTRKSICDISQFTTDGDRLVSCNSHYHDYAIDKDEIDRSREYFYYYDPNSDRCIAFLDDSFLLYGQFYCYSVDSDGRMTYLGSGGTDDGFFPFADYDYENWEFVTSETTVEIDEQGRTVLKAKNFSITWTDTGAIVEYDFGSGGDYFPTIELDYPKT